MAEIVDRFANLSAEQRQLVLKKIQERGLAQKKKALDFQAPPIAPVSRDGELPLSFSQQRLWFIDQWEPGNPTYNVFSGVRLAGRLNVEALKWGLNEVVQRHEVLRTTFTRVEGQPIQVIAPTLRVSLPIIDLRELPPTEREVEARRLATQEAQWSFDLASGPLLRASLLWLASTDHLLLLNMHHIISDGWSMGVFVREMAWLYQAFIAGQPAPLPDLPFQYADFAVWQREWLQGAVLEEQLTYWQTQLADAQTVLDLPTDYARPPMQTMRGALCPFQISASLTEALRALSRAEESTLFMTLLAAFNVLLHRYTGQSDILVGTPIANRRWDELEGLIGFFVNTLVLRTNLAGAPTFRELLRRVRETTLEAYGHQDVPFEMLVEKLQHERDISRAPLFQVMFVLQNVPQQPLKSSSLTLSPVDVDSGTAMFDLMLGLVEVEEGLTGEFQYNTDLFDEATIVRLVNHWQGLLAGIVANPDRPLWDLPLLTETERHQLLIGWNAAHPGPSQEQCVHELFESQVERTPEAVAAVWEDQQLTYGELNGRANQLAHDLRALGVGAGVPVGLCLERSLEMMIGLLGILKAGGAYVPLDPAYPLERLAFILKDAQIKVLVTQEHLAAQLPVHDLSVVILEGAPSSLLVQASKDNLASITQPADLAYIIYTSGSTGQPKGVLISQQALVHYATTTLNHFALTPADGVLQFASISFDAAGEEIYPCLLAGAKLVLRTEAMLGSVEVFLQKCAAEHVTILDLPTAYWHTVVAEREASAAWELPPSLRLIIIGGERALPEQVQAWRAQASRHICLLNTYGPTETTIVATRCELHGNQAVASASRAPIGKPIAGRSVYILNSHLQPVPIGVPGELYIGGVGLAWGYLNQAGLTAAKFIPDPFSAEAGARLYKTGDWVRYLPDGNIEFLGRIDHQVKVRGFRIELGEIEAVLGQHPAVRETVVLAREETPGEKQLVAYIVPKNGQVPSGGEWRNFLEERLPAYMVPSAFMPLERLPLTPSGKVDRRALPLPGKPSAAAKKFVAPEGPLEEKLAEIWGQTLKVDQLSTHDNFFDLGGHSLLATQVIYRVNKAFQIDLSLRNLFETPTIARMALLIEGLLLDELEEETEESLSE